MVKRHFLYYKGKFIKLKEYRESIYNVHMARDDAIKMLRDLENSKDISEFKNPKNNDKYLYANLFLHRAKAQKWSI